MSHETTLVPALMKEQRRHPRAQLSLPVRLRWLSPLGQLTEVTETLDVGRGGLLVHRREPCCVGARVWVTFPFDPSLLLAQPETPARVVRVATTPAGGNLVALELEPPRPSDAAGRTHTRFARERRRHERLRLVLPIRVRPADSPWPEETMTVDISDDGVLFCTTRLYAAGDAIYIALPPRSFGGRWISPAELAARVVRITRDARSAVWQQVAAALLPPEKP
jgi:hypothetical protein